MRLFPNVDLDGHQTRMYRLLTAVFFFTLAGYWLIRPLKMGVFVKVVGIEEEPRAKLGTVFVLIPILMGYNKLFMVVKHTQTLVLTVCSAFALVFAWTALALMTPSIPVAAGDDDVQPLPQQPSRWVGWLVYWSIESFGTVIVAMMWSIVASVSTEQLASSVYPTIVIFQQLGAVSGATLATFTKRFGTFHTFMRNHIDLAPCTHNTYPWSKGSRFCLGSRLSTFSSAVFLLRGHLTSTKKGSVCFQLDDH